MGIKAVVKGALHAADFNYGAYPRKMERRITAVFVNHLRHPHWIMPGPHRRTATVQQSLCHWGNLGGDQIGENFVSVP